MMKLYISGPITGWPNKNKPAFDVASSRLVEMGVEVVNPFDFEQDGFSWEDYLKRDLNLMFNCDGLFLLPMWEESRGARLEVVVATALGMPCYFLLNDKLEILPIISEPVITPLVPSYIWNKTNS